MNPDDFKHSYSTLSAFDTCPLSFAAKSVYKTIKFKGNAASQWGSACHEAAEKRIKTNEPLVGRFEFMEPIVGAVIKAANGALVEAEKELGITKDKRPISFWDGKLRGKLDAFYKVDPARGVIADWKVADPKYQSKYDLETDVFSFLTFCNDPEVEKIKSVLLWCKQDMPAPPTVKMLTRADMSRLEDSIFSKMERVEEAIGNDEFKPKRGGLCAKYCEVPCKFNGTVPLK